MSQTTSDTGKHVDLTSSRFESLTLMCAGAIGAATVTILTALARSLGYPSLSIENILGSLLMGYVGPSPWMVGFILFLAFNAIAALVYGAIFRKLGAAGPSIGAAIGFAHWIFSGIALGFLSMIHPLMPESLLSPGFFAINTGTFGFFFIFLLHMIFGAIVGRYYQQACMAHQSLTSRPV